MDNTNLYFSYDTDPHSSMASIIDIGNDPSGSSETDSSTNPVISDSSDDSKNEYECLVLGCPRKGLRFRNSRDFMRHNETTHGGETERQVRLEQFHILILTNCQAAHLSHQ